MSGQGVKRAVSVMLTMFLCVVLLGCAAAYYAACVDRSLPVASGAIIVEKGATASEVARRLASAGIIRSPLLFAALVRIEHAGQAIRAGEFRFSEHQTTDNVLHELISGGQQVAVWVTFPEGFTAREIAHALAERHIGSEQAFTTYFLHHGILLDGTRTRSLEGFLFPSTYLVPLEASPEAAARMFVDQFLRELPSEAARRARRLGLTVPQVVAVASLIEREAKADSERPLMAGVYYNRLRRGMPLEVDATIEYSFPEHKDIVTLADLARDSPYNTYKHTGLPPTPIADPGRASLWAAFNPQPSDYLFYVYKGNGRHAFSRTLAEHQANIARYLH